MARAPITSPAMTPLESLCDGDEAKEEDEKLPADVMVGEYDPALEVEDTTATPSANPSYGEAKAWAPEYVAVKIEVAFKADLS